MAITLTKGMKLLFQGDSITDCGHSGSQNGIGSGYVYMLASWLWGRYPELELTIHNRGVCGNRIRDLRERWEADCLELRPDLVSILIGINDTWRRYDSNDPSAVEPFYEDYRFVLRQTTEALDAQLVICEPFLLPSSPDRKAWSTDLDPKIAAVRELAREFGAALVPLDGVFAAASVKRECSYWAEDGVHPSVAGHALICRAWLQHVLAETL